MSLVKTNVSNISGKAGMFKGKLFSLASVNCAGDKFQTDNYQLSYCTPGGEKKRKKIEKEDVALNSCTYITP